MRETDDSFAFRPATRRRGIALLGRGRAWASYTARGWQALGTSSLLVAIALAMSFLALTLLSIVMTRRAVPRLQAMLRSGKRAAAPALSRLGHRLLISFRPSALAPAVRKAASWRPQPIRAARRRSRRVSTVLALGVVILVLGGLVPVNAAPFDITTVAGHPDFGDGGPSTSAVLRATDVATDAAGNVYIADTDNHRIRRIDTSGTITTVAGNGTSGFSGDGGPATSARLRFPEGVWVTGGVIYIADTGNERIRKVDASGNISTIAGTGTAGFSGDGGPATAAQLHEPEDLTTDAAGNLYIADRKNHRVRKVTPGGTITTFAGNGIEGFAGDGGAATAARLNDPTGVAVDSLGVVYIADRDNHRVRKVKTDGKIDKWAGNGTAGYCGDGGDAHNECLNFPEDVSVDSANNTFIADSANNRIRKVKPDKKISTVAGNGTAGFAGDGGPATSAELDDPIGIAAGPGGVLYMIDSNNHRVRRVTSGGTISTYAGRNPDGGDGGSAIDGVLSTPLGTAVDGAGNLYIADFANNRVRRVSGGAITTVAGTGGSGSSGDGGPATSALLAGPSDVAVDSAGNLYIADSGNNRVRKVDAGGTITTVAGTGIAGFSGDGGPAASARLWMPLGVEVDSAGNLYIADFANNRIRKVTPGGTISTVAGGGSCGAGGFGGDGGPATAACLDSPSDVAMHAGGTMYIADYDNHRIRSVSTSGIIRTHAGNGVAGFGGDGGPATSASLRHPLGIEVDPAGNVFVADSENNRIRRVDLAGNITSVAGTGVLGFSGDGGPAITAQLAFPAMLALDAGGNLYLPDALNDRVRMIEGIGQLQGPVLTGTTPGSPANDNSPRVQGTAAAGSTVKIYKSATCTGPIAGTGSAAELASPGIAASVADNTTTSFYATSTNGTGQVSGCSMTPVLYIEDSNPPAAPTITLEPASPGSDITPTWSFTTDAGATAECEVSHGGVPVYPYAPCSSPATFDLTGQPDGVYTFSVRAKDAAGNTGPVAIDSYVLDSTIPVAPIINSSPSTPSDDLTPTWHFTVEPGSTAECEMSYEGTVVDPFGPCTSPYTLDLTGGLDGTYTVRIQARDGAGNPSAPVSSNYVLDTTDPGLPTISGGPSSPGNSTSPGWTFTVDPGSTAECQLTRGGVVVSAWQACSSPESFDLAGEPDGDYTFSVRAVDAAGNTGPVETSGYTLDTTGPEASITSSPSSPDRDTDPTWAFSTQPAVSVECQLERDGVVVSPWALCASPQPYDLTTEPDGVYTFLVRATDDAGNTGDPDSGVYVFDTTPPVVSITSGPEAFSSEQNPQWSFVSEAGVTMECELVAAVGGVIQSLGPCSSPQSYDLTGLPDDTYTFSVQGTDLAGNLGPVTNAAYTLDTSGPASSVTSSPSSPDNVSSPSWGFTAEAGSTTECQLTGPGGTLSTWTPCVSPQLYNLTGQIDGAYSFSVRATDAAGNIGAPAGHTYTLDRSAPATLITLSPASPGTSRNPSWSFTTELGATTECELSRGGVVVDPWGSCLSPEIQSLAGQPDGTYTFRVRATDGPGNTGPAQSSTYTLDTTGPNVSLQGPSSPGNSRTPSWSFTTESGAATDCELSSGTLVLQPFASCSSPASFSLAVQPDGAYTLRVRATDAAGNVGQVASADYELDATGPDTTIVSGPTSPGSTTNPSWAFTTEAGASTKCELSGPSGVIQPFGACNSPEGYDILSNPDGVYTFSVRSTDAAGNDGAVASATYTLDTTAPPAPTITSSPPSPGKAKQVSWAFTAETGATTECELTSAAGTIQPFGPCDGSSAHDLSSNPDGDYTFAVRAADALGNTSGLATSSYTLDTTGPEVTFTSEPSSPGANRNPTWRFSVEAGATVDCTFSSGNQVLDRDATCPSPVSFSLNGEPDGTYTLKVSAKDQLGNEGQPNNSKYTLQTAEEEQQPVVPPPAQPPKAGTTDEPTDGGAEPAPAPNPHHAKQHPGPSEEEPAAVEANVVPTPEEGRELTEKVVSPPSAIGEFLEGVGTVAAGLLQQPAFPLTLILLVVGFLVVQNRMDHRDPKLALAPVYPDPHLYFDAQESPGTDR